MSELFNVKNETHDTLDDNDSVILHRKKSTDGEKSHENLVFTMTNVTLNMLYTAS